MDVRDPWRCCSKCGKSFDAVYRTGAFRVFGCRTCHRTEPVNQTFADIVVGSGLAAAGSVSARRESPPARVLETIPRRLLPTLSRLERLQRFRMAVG